MIQLLQDIEKIVPTLDGWCSVKKAHALAFSIFTLRPDLTVEIGVFGGRSLIPMAMAHRETGKGRVIGIDPWSNAASAEGQNGANREWWGKQCNHEEVMQKYLSKVNEMGLGPWIQNIRARSDTIAAPDNIDILHVDGNHGPQAVRDTEKFAPHVRIGGLIFFDDLDWDGGAVRRSVDIAKGLGFIELYRMDTGAMFQRIK